MQGVVNKLDNIADFICEWSLEPLVLLAHLPELLVQLGELVDLGLVDAVDLAAAERGRLLLQLVQQEQNLLLVVAGYSNLQCKGMKMTGHMCR